MYENKKQRNTVIINLIVLAFLAGVYFFTSKEYYDGSKQKEENIYHLVFEKMNQEDTHTLTLKKGDILNIDYSIKKGKVTITIKGNDKKIYNKQNCKTYSGTITIEEDGQYDIVVIGRNCQGEIKIEIIN